MTELSREEYRRRIGTGGSREPLEIITHGQKRFEVRATEPAIEGQPVSADPTPSRKAGTGVFFFRSSGGKSQLCVIFPSGATQIIATEP